MEMRDLVGDELEYSNLPDKRLDKRLKIIVNCFLK
jgi:hypothetical protein